MRIEVPNKETIKGCLCIRNTWQICVFLVERKGGHYTTSRKDGGIYVTSWRFPYDHLHLRESFLLKLLANGLHLLREYILLKLLTKWHAPKYMFILGNIGNEMEEIRLKTWCHLSACLLHLPSCQIQETKSFIQVMNEDMWITSGSLP